MSRFALYAHDAEPDKKHGWSLSRIFAWVILWASLLFWAGVFWVQR